MIDGDDSYEIYAIRYAHDAHRLMRENFIPPLSGPKDIHDSLMPVDFFVWVVKNAKRTILVDTGFDQKEATRRGRSVAMPIDQGLDALGLKPQSIDDIVLTHMHWDHAGNHDMFPRAKYHVQEREMAFCTGRCMCHPFVRRPYSVDDVTAMIGKVFAGRTQFHDGDSVIAPGISVHHVGGHTQGLQVVRVKTARGWVVLASDASHFYENMNSCRPFPVVISVPEMMAGYERVRELSSSADHWIPGHDPLVMTKYPLAVASNPNIVRLDVSGL